MNECGDEMFRPRHEPLPWERSSIQAGMECFHVVGVDKTHVNEANEGMKGWWVDWVEMGGGEQG